MLIVSPVEDDLTASASDTAPVRLSVVGVPRWRDRVVVRPPIEGPHRGGSLEHRSESDLPALHWRCRRGRWQTCPKSQAGERAHQLAPLPVAPAHAVDRSELRRRLDEALVRSLTLIVAPAGAGKSVLLAQWAASHPELAFVWLEVGVDDDDPVKFSQRLLAGFADINPDFADLTSLTSLHGGGLGTSLLEALEAQLGDLPEVVIVLDDLHLLTNSVLISDLGRLANLLPPNIHLVLSTRTDLPIAWSRHRVSDQLTEIRQSDLALDEIDSASLLEHISGRELGIDSVASLVARTEGWAAGLQLAGMTLRLYNDSDEFITQFSGDDRLIADYLSEEVLQAQPDDRRELLLRVSVLDTMCADLVSLLTASRTRSSSSKSSNGIRCSSFLWTLVASGFASTTSFETCFVSSYGPSTLISRAVCSIRLHRGTSSEER